MKETVSSFKLRMSYGASVTNRYLSISTFPIGLHADNINYPFDGKS